MDFGVEILIGVVMLFFGLKIADRRRSRSESRTAPAAATPVAAFSFGFMLNVVGFPGAIPYFAAADQIAKADLPSGEAILAVVYYVLVFVLPLSMLTLLHRLAGPGINKFLQSVNAFFGIWGRRLMMVLLILLGLALIVDGTLYFLRGEPLVPIGYPGQG